MITETLDDKRPTAWHRVKLPTSMRLLRRLRPLILRIAMPVLLYLRKRNAATIVCGLHLRTALAVFHPRFFFSSRILGEFIVAQNLRQQRLLDMGTGSGIIAILAARAGAEVIALDLNPLAVQLATENVQAHGLTGQVSCRTSDLFAVLSPDEKFDWIVFNPPFFAGEASSIAAAAWYAGTGHETIDGFLVDARNHLGDDGQIVLILSSDMPLSRLDHLFRRHGYRVADCRRKRHWFEFFFVVNLQPVA